MSTPPPLPTHNPYAAPAARVHDVPAGTLELADRGIRLAAALIDGLIWAALGFGMAIILPIVAPQGGDSAAAANAVMAVGGLLAIGLVVLNLLWLYQNGQTIGKRLLSIKVVRADGERCPLWRILFLRGLPMALIGAVPLIGPIVTWLVDPLFIFRADLRCLHDLIADTIVVKA